MNFSLLRQRTVKVEKKLGNHISTLPLIFLLGKYSFSAQGNVCRPPVPAAFVSEVCEQQSCFYPWTQLSISTGSGREKGAAQGQGCPPQSGSSPHFLNTTVIFVLWGGFLEGGLNCE